MTYETWIAFVLASAIVVVIPGPNIILTVNFALRSGRRTGWGTVTGTALGALVAMSATLMGAGAILATSVTLFSILKIAGAAYLIWMAYCLWTAPVEEVEEPGSVAGRSLWSIFAQSFLVSALNPKGPVFYMAFVPQFVNTSLPVFEQFAILTATFVGVAALNGMMWLFFASGLRARLQKPRARRAVNRTGASCMFAAGVFTANASRVG
ncbi:MULTISPECIES: LysE family translocator [Parasedimentitalea]|uniref:LysE family translocator n=2 Tax=Parasedimentitalea TaxID=2738399 RepID=A0A6L6WFM6_9RHOB|nr:MULTISPECIES: LysE family translocator [Zongyanglinia]KAE9630489.1 LysE family transporter [Zongyanglinia marina]MVO16068.1 LysE family translocator [Zongyanglinia huanghaiensis]